MFEWIGSWWYGNDTMVAPARNAPNEGRDIKKILESKNERFLSITAEEINKVLSNLKRPATIERVAEVSEPKTPLEEISRLDLDNYFKNLKIRRRC